MASAKEYHREYYRKNRDKILARNRANPNAAEAKRRYKQKIKDYVNNVKANSKCADCGRSDEPYLMDFHHKDGSKEFKVSDLSRSFAKVKEEIAKCVVLCCRCHRIRHH